MIVYIDNDCKCHTSDNGTMRAVETDFFDGKCAAFIEGHRFKPDGETWVREDGKVFSGGEMISPWKNSTILAAYQAQYEALLPEIQVREAALAELGVTADD